MDTNLTPVTSTNASRELEGQKKRLRESCREFESVMISYLMKTMRESVLKAEEPDHARETYEDMLAGQMSRELSKTSALGLGNMLYTKLEPLVKTQKAVAQNPAKSEALPAAAEGSTPPVDSLSHESEKPAKACASLKRAKCFALKK